MVVAVAVVFDFFFVFGATDENNEIEKEKNITKVTDQRRKIATQKIKQNNNDEI